MALTAVANASGIASLFLLMLMTTTAHNQNLTNLNLQTLDNAQEKLFNQYDFIIVGAGSAGKF